MWVLAEGHYTEASLGPHLNFQMLGFPSLASLNKRINTDFRRCHCRLYIWGFQILPRVYTFFSRVDWRFAVLLNHHVSLFLPFFFFDISLFLFFSRNFILRSSVGVCVFMSGSHRLCHFCYHKQGGDEACDDVTIFANHRLHPFTFIC